ncbi:MAG TPA: hypothetical protein VEU27_14690 [Gemmatimonadales bacterium]|nr:hypothetical protein [Gemmatimonadales bacterium]
MPVFAPVLVGAALLAFPGAGGGVLLRAEADEPRGEVTRHVFYGGGYFDMDPVLYTGAVRTSTPISVSRDGDMFFGFTVMGDTPIRLRSGVAKLCRSGEGGWLSAATACGDDTVTGVAYNCAPALSLDERLLYVAVTRYDGTGYLIAAETDGLTPVSSVRLADVKSGLDARISSDSSASPAVGRDGDVYFGVLENPFGTNNGRGWLLHFDRWLSEIRLPGAFGWDETASTVPAAAVRNYTGPSSYLLVSKYNNYLDFGGDGRNRMALLDPATPAVDGVSGAVVMREVATIASPTPEAGDAGSGAAVTEWCPNSVAVDAATASAFMTNEDGKLYRWDLNANAFSAVVPLSRGAREAYTPTVVGVDEALYAISGGTLFRVEGEPRLWPGGAGRGRPRGGDS